MTACCVGRPPTRLVEVTRTPGRIFMCRPRGTQASDGAQWRPWKRASVRVAAGHWMAAPCCAAAGSSAVLNARVSRALEAFCLWPFRPRRPAGHWPESASHCRGETQPRASTEAAAGSRAASDSVENTAFRSASMKRCVLASIALVSGGFWLRGGPPRDQAAVAGRDPSTS